MVDLEARASRKAEVTRRASPSGKMQQGVGACCTTLPHESSVETCYLELRLASEEVSSGRVAVARLLTREGEEICYLVRLVIERLTFDAEVAFYLDFRETLGDAILDADGAHYRVFVDAWDVISEDGHRVRRVRGRIAAKTR